MKTRWQAALLVLVFSSAAAAQNGWHQDRFNAQKMNSSPVVGPSSQLPQFQVLIMNAPGILEAIADDGTLILSNGAEIDSYSRTGTFKWRAAMSASNVAIAPSGNIYAQTASSVTALKPDTGQILWTYSSGFGDETTPFAIDSKGVAYLQSGCSNCLMGPALLSAINPDGTLSSLSYIYF